MGELTVSIEQYRGKSFDIGAGFGEHDRMKLIRERCEQLVQPIDVNEARTILSRFAPHLLNELEGIANALKISHEESIALFSGYDLPKLEGLGCTAIMTEEGYVRNYDFGPDFYDARLILRQPKEAYATCGYSLFGIGLHDGMNEHGLAVGLHFVSTRLHQKGLMAGLIVRIVLDRCRTVQEAEELLSELPHADEYNYSLADGLGNSAIVEAGPFQSHVLKGTRLCCANHFQMTPGQTPSENSLKRFEYIEKHAYIGIASWFNEFRNPKSPLFFHDYENLFGTLHTLMIDSSTLTLKTSIAGSEEIITIPFKRWMEGEELLISMVSVTL
ncbi:C45 family autoproteolytic acyltransferase/hydolase [Guptibacillus hwajinpoensis]|uniref:Choloylglycine hydrolase n=1 Tax=Guptibacillus hwajinpoensis TaxID=208199 RepID=A0ABU0JYP4_9BACL|nr:C45 family peptidase [Alkalihalobacillus hemicentroti]MDQ0482206.1 putative choloylglycine hydrolase [Alkalihalobacillus hemicentroti]